MPQRLEKFTTVQTNCVRYSEGLLYCDSFDMAAPLAQWAEEGHT
jgi:hypothetical protein